MMFRAAHFHSAASTLTTMPRELNSVRHKFTTQVFSAIFSQDWILYPVAIVRASDDVASKKTPSLSWSAITSKDSRRHNQMQASLSPSVLTLARWCKSLVTRASSSNLWVELKKWKQCRSSWTNSRSSIEVCNLKAEQALLHVTQDVHWFLPRPCCLPLIRLRISKLGWGLGYTDEALIVNIVYKARGRGLRGRVSIEHFK